MEHRVTMTVELTVEAPETKTQDDVEGFAYWLLEPHLEEMVTSAYDFDGCQVKDFNIDINQEK